LEAPTDVDGSSSTACRNQCDLLLPVRDNLPRRSAKLFVMTVPEFGRCDVDYALMVPGLANLFGGRRLLSQRR
jgi:hypothetical protein